MKTFFTELQIKSNKTFFLNASLSMEPTPYMWEGGGGEEPANLADMNVNINSPLQEFRLNILKRGLCVRVSVSKLS